MSKKQAINRLAEHFKNNPPEPFCERYPSLGHPVDENGRCVGCGKVFPPKRLKGERVMSSE